MHNVIPGSAGGGGTSTTLPIPSTLLLCEVVTSSVPGWTTRHYTEGQGEGGGIEKGYITLEMHLPSHWQICNSFPIWKYHRFN